MILKVRHAEQHAGADGGRPCGFPLNRFINPPDPGVGVYVEAPDLDDEVAKLKAAGLTFESDPVDQPWLWREAYLRDPAGNLLPV